MAGTYQYDLVALSIVIAMSAAYVALDLAGRTAAAAKGRMRTLWLTGGAASMGLGIWSMHYIGMLAFTLPVPVLYDLPMVLLSLSLGVASTSSGHATSAGLLQAADEALYRAQAAGRNRVEA